MLKVGTLVGWRGSYGIILGKVKRRGACPTDVWVKWTDETDLKWENGMLLEVINEPKTH